MYLKLLKSFVLASILAPCFAWAQQSELSRSVELEADLSRAAITICTGQASSDSAILQSAEKALDTIHRAMLDGLLDGLASPSPEIRSRAAETLKLILEEAHLARASMLLPAQMQESLFHLAEIDRPLVMDVLAGSEKACLAALERIDKMKDPSGSTSCLLVAALYLGSDVAADHVAEMVARHDRYRSDNIGVALVCAGVRKAENIAGGRMGYAYPQKLDPLLAAQLIRGERTAAALCSALLEYGGKKNITLDLRLAIGLGQSGRQEFLPVLFRKIDTLTFAGAQNYGTVTQHKNDVFIYAFVALAGENAASYGLVEQTNMVGFAKGDDLRDKAVARLKEWYASQNEAMERFEKFPPFVPDFGQFLKDPLAAWQVARAASAPAATAAPMADAIHKSAADLEKKAAAAVSELVAEFKHPAQRQRQKAQQGILRTYRGFLSGIRESSGSGGAGAAGAPTTLENCISQARFYDHVASLTAAGRTSMLKLRQVHGGAMSELFARDLRTASTAAKRILADGEVADCEPLLLYCLGHHSPVMARLAAEAAATGKFRSDVVVDALMGILMKAGSSSWYHFTVNTTQAPSIEVLSLRAVNKIGSKRALPGLLAMLVDDAGTVDYYRPTVLSEAVMAIKDDAMIPVLIEALDRPAARTPQVLHVNPATKATVSWTPADHIIVAVLGATDQDPADYKVVSVPLSGQKINIKGFVNEADRTAAKAKLKKWWQDNKDKPPYKDIQPLVLPDVPKPAAPYVGTERL